MILVKFIEFYCIQFGFRIISVFLDFDVGFSNDVVEKQ